MGYTIKLRHPDAERRSGRLVVEGATGCYHVVNRTARREYWFEDKHKAVFLKILLKQAAFSGVEVLSYCVMSNHFHLLIRIPFKSQESIDDEELMRRFEALYGDYHPFSVPEPGLLRRILKENGELAEKWRRQLKARMGRLDSFMSELKQRFMIWFNSNYDNEGTIFAQTYRSTLIEDHWQALSIVSAYIDLNPVRARIVDDPVAYAFCSYAALMTGEAGRQEAINKIFSDTIGDPKIALETYRMLLYERGAASKRNTVEEGPDSGIIRSGKVKKVLNRQGKLALGEALRMKVRYFTAGGIIGSRDFLNGVFQANRDYFPSGRCRAGSAMRQGEWGGLHVFRRLQKSIMVPPD